MILFTIIFSIAKQELWPWLLPFAFVLSAFAILAPQCLISVIKIMDKLHWFIRKVLFFVLFFIFITPLSLLLRAIRPEMVVVNTNRKASSYWETPEKKSYHPDDFHKQF
ncbi:hypothetical protein ABHF91_00560 [Pseudaeromonas sp. ZJS20]|uniref:hypothetical protein n=1 Tax=Pseudaeromonas aegiceratis TaxID=3153928 RepID=UPI00390C6E44